MKNSTRLLVIALLLLSVAMAFMACGGDDGPAAPQNSAPVFREFTMSDLAGLWRLLPGDEIVFSALASDPDIEPVTYLWELEVSEVQAIGKDPGVLQDENTRSATWTVGDFAGDVQIKCTISDGKESVVRYAGKPFSLGVELGRSTVSADTTWTNADEPIVITEELTIQAGATLTIAAGTTVYIRPRSGLGGFSLFPITVEGSLVVNGTPESGVTISGAFDDFPSTSTDQHEGIVFNSSSSSQLNYLTLEDGESGINHIGSGVVRLSDCFVRGNATGILGSDLSVFVIERTTLSQNSIGIQSNGGQLTLTDCEIRECSQWALRVDSTTASGAVVQGTGCTFTQNLGLNLSARSTTGLTSVQFERSNFIPMLSDEDTMSLSCSPALSVDLRGNHWGLNGTSGSQILLMFVGSADCGQGIASWSDTSCNATGDPACDFKTSPF